MMTVDASIHYLYNKVKEDKNSTANEINAINSLIQYVNNSKKEQLIKNKLFTKLYVIYFGILIENFKDIDFSQIEIQKKLSEPLGFHLQFLRLKINNLDSENFLKSINLDLIPYFMKDKKELEIEGEVLKQNITELINHSQRFSYDFVVDSLNIQITEAINKFQHYD